MRAVNLLPLDASYSQRSLRSLLPLLAAGVVPIIAVGLIVIGYNGASATLTADQGQLATLQAEVARMTPAQAVAVPDTSILVAARAARLSALTDALTKQIAWDSTLGEIARVVPPNVWLTALNATSPTPADAVAVAAPGASPSPSTTTTTTTTTTPASVAAPSATSFTVTGYAYTSDDVALLLQRLQLLPMLSNVTLSSTQTIALGLKSAVQFSLSAALGPTPAGVTP